MDHLQPEKAQLNRLWEIIEDEFWKMGPEHLLVIALHEVDIAQQVVDAEGGKIMKEAHNGARARAREMIAAAEKK